MDDPHTPNLEDQLGILINLPRREMLDALIDIDEPTKMRVMNFKFGRFLALGSLYQWISLVIRFSITTLWDKIIRKDSEDRQAVRLRKSFERRGGSFVKLGIHLAVRMDLIPWTYSLELASMGDYMPPFPVKEAIQVIERALKVPLQSVFSQFDPEPITSSSVACIYQARYHHGQKVIVKVRRPKVGKQFMADLQGFEWLLMLAEFLTIFRPGFTVGMRKEFRDYLMNELDFLQEARRQDAFRRMAEESGKKFFSAPRVYLEHTSEEVIVEEFAAGMWVWELLAAIENNHQGVLEQARQMNIDPKKVAKRLMWVNYWSRNDSLFFNANPLPTNIIIGYDSRLYFTDFATTGSLSRSKKQAFQQIMKYTEHNDPQNMARAMLILLEPLPPVDLVVLTQELEGYNWEMIYSQAADPKSLTWQERTSGVQWHGLVHLARKYGIVVDIRVLRMLHSTLYYESMAVRLHHNINFIKQYRNVERYRAEVARRRVTDAIEDSLDGKENERLIILLDRVAYTLESLFYRTRHLLSLPSINFNVLMSKWAFFISSFFHFFVQVIITTGAAILVMVGSKLISGLEMPEPLILLQSVLQHPVYLFLILGLMLANGRAVLFRMDDKEV